MSHAISAVWNALPLILSGGFVLLFLIGFWHGMSIKPRRSEAPEYTPPPGWPGGSAF
jgi:hypothetical protein